MSEKLTASMIYMVVDALIGEVEPYGDTRIDSDRIENLDRLIELVSMLLDSIQIQCVYLGRPEASISEIAEKAYNYIQDLNEQTSDWIDGYKVEKGVSR